MSRVAGMPQYSYVMERYGADGVLWWRVVVRALEDLYATHETVSRSELASAAHFFTAERHAMRDFIFDHLNINIHEMRPIILERVEILKEEGRL
jgi:hypothetical protein